MPAFPPPPLHHTRHNLTEELIPHEPDETIAITSVALDVADKPDPAQGGWPVILRIGQEPPLELVVTPTMVIPRTHGPSFDDYVGRKKFDPAEVTFLVLYHVDP